MDYYSSDPTAGLVSGLISFVFAVLMIIAMWRVFSKADRPGWYAIIPILNIYTLVKIGGFEGWFTILFFIPVVGFIIYIVVALGVAKNFGKSGVFGFVGLVLFSFIGWLMLGFGSAKYVGQAA